jgi:DNA (cytosine-5)-methyltransferase 1
VILSKTDKPEYKVPTMPEIAAIPWNGYKVASTFSGCGGSCLGYRMAGFKVIWANEFVPAAQQTYKANCAKDCYLDCRDIRQVQPEEALEKMGLRVGELDLFDGSPPCQAFSTAGKRAKGWGKAKTYEHGAKQCNERLFDEYIRLLRGIKPKVFVAENVSGLVKGVAKGMFLEILAALKESGYNVKCKVLDAQWLGVPQMRQRTIFIGVREDLGVEPAHPSPLPYRYSVRDALPWITSCKSGPTGFGAGSIGVDKVAPTISASMQAPWAAHPAVEMIIGNDSFKTKWGSLDNTSPTIVASGAHGGNGQVRQGAASRKFTIAEVKRICAFPDDFILTGSYAQQWERLGNSVPPVMMFHIARVIRDSILDKAQ